MFELTSKHGSLFPKYVQNLFPSFLRLHQDHDQQAQLFDPDEYEYDPRIGNHFYQENFYNQIEVALSVGLIHHSIQWCNPYYLIKMLKLIRNLDYYRVDVQELIEQIITLVTIPSNKLEECFNTIGLHANKTQTIYQLVGQTKLEEHFKRAFHEHIHSVESLLKHVKQQIGLEVILIDEYEPQQLLFNNDTLILFKDSVHSQSPFVILNQYETQRERQIVFEMAKRIHFQKIQKLILFKDEQTLSELMQFTNLNQESFFEAILHFDNEMTQTQRQQLHEQLENFDKRLWGDDQLQLESLKDSGYKPKQVNVLEDEYNPRDAEYNPRNDEQNPQINHHSQQLNQDQDEEDYDPHYD